MYKPSNSSEAVTVSNTSQQTISLINLVEGMSNSIVPFKNYQLLSDYQQNKSDDIKVIISNLITTHILRDVK